MPSSPQTAVAARKPGTFLLAAGLVAILAGCGGSSSNGIASKTPAEILAASKTAAEHATSVHITSESRQGRARATLNLELARNAGHAQVSLLGITFELIRVENTLYIKGSPAFYSRLGLTTNPPPGTWIKVPANGTLAQLAAFTNLKTELNLLLSTDAPPAKGATTTVNGQQAIELKETAKLFKGTLYIATTGQPNPLELLKRGRETGHTILTNWNQPLTINPPANTTTVG